MDREEDPILLKDIWPIENVRDYKVHFARVNDDWVEPLDVWVNNREEWIYWQRWRPQRNAFNRPYIFSLMRFYHEPDTWLFGGIFKVLSAGAKGYEVELKSTKEYGAHFVGRLKLFTQYRQRAARVNFENHFFEDSSYPLQVSEIFPEPYSGSLFPGYENIDISSAQLKAIIDMARPDWKAALQSVKGVYLVTDQETGKLYVGSAYGDHGIWSRWGKYADSGHGGNEELKKLKARYCRKYMRFSLLQTFSIGAQKEDILERENWWKQVLRSRKGLNRN